MDRPNEAFPLQSLVVIKEKTIVREEEDLESEEVGELEEGEECEVLEHGVGAAGRRLRIVGQTGARLQGWISCVSNKGRKFIVLKGEEAPASSGPRRTVRGGSRKSAVPELGAAPVEEAFPLGSEVVILESTIVRSGEDLQSPQVRELHQGNVCQVVEHGASDGRRLRIMCATVTPPAEGWISYVSKSGRKLVDLRSDSAREAAPAPRERRSIAQPSPLPITAREAAPEVQQSHETWAPAPARPSILGAGRAPAGLRASISQGRASVAPVAEQAKGRPELVFYVDNRALKSRSSGLPYHGSKDPEDKDPTRSAPWGKTVVGRDLDDGWLQVGSLFLPFHYEGVRVLLSEAQATEEDILPSFDTFATGAWMYVCIDYYGVSTQRDPEESKFKGEKINQWESVEIAERGENELTTWLRLKDGRGWIPESTKRRHMVELVPEPFQKDPPLFLIVRPMLEKAVPVSESALCPPPRGGPKLLSGQILRVLEKVKVALPDKKATDPDKEVIWFEVSQAAGGSAAIKGWLPELDIDGEKLLHPFKETSQEQLIAENQGRQCFISVLDARGAKILSVPGRSGKTGKKLPPGEFKKVLRRISVEGKDGKEGNRFFLFEAEGEECQWVAEFDPRGEREVDFLPVERHEFRYICDDKDGANVRSAPTRHKTKNVGKSLRHKQRVDVLEKVTFSDGDVLLRYDNPMSKKDPGGWVPEKKKAGGVKMKLDSKQPPRGPPVQTTGPMGYSQPGPGFPAAGGFPPGTSTFPPSYGSPGGYGGHGATPPAPGGPGSSLLPNGQSQPPYGGAPMVGGFPGPSPYGSGYGAGGAAGAASKPSPEYGQPPSNGTDQYGAYGGQSGAGGQQAPKSSKPSLEYGQPPSNGTDPFGAYGGQSPGPGQYGGFGAQPPINGAPLGSKPFGAYGSGQPPPMDPGYSAYGVVSGQPSFNGAPPGSNGAYGGASGQPPLNGAPPVDPSYSAYGGANGQPSANGFPPIDGNKYGAFGGGPNSQQTSAPVDGKQFQDTYGAFGGGPSSQPSFVGSASGPSGGQPAFLDAGAQDQYRAFGGPNSQQDQYGAFAGLSSQAPSPPQDQYGAVAGQAPFNGSAPQDQYGAFGGPSTQAPFNGSPPQDKYGTFGGPNSQAPFNGSAPQDQYGGFGGPGSQAASPPQDQYGAFGGPSGVNGSSPQDQYGAFGDAPGANGYQPSYGGPAPSGGRSGGGNTRFSTYSAAGRPPGAGRVSMDQSSLMQGGAPGSSVAAQQPPSGRKGRGQPVH